ncbi:hypothetical protein HKX48_004993 [Thoreauomyces humboldtii]|nr:hypothetical protein HKX48_004993 [Thoreauomyces humboldtii]
MAAVTSRVSPALLGGGGGGSSTSGIIGHISDDSRDSLLEDSTAFEAWANRGHIPSHNALPPISSIHTHSHNINTLGISHHDQPSATTTTTMTATTATKRQPESKSQLAYVDGTPSLVLSLRACEECQRALVSAFDHCLGRTNGQPLMESVNQIDEVDDGRRLTDPPYFEIVRDPTRPKNTVYTDLSQKVERERWAFNETRKVAKMEQAGNARGVATVRGGVIYPPSPTTSIQSGHLFSGAVYKRTLEAKEREVQMLRGQLYDRISAEKTEQGDIEKLRGALKKAVNYYVYAEEWQAAESARLQRDVRYMKAELSSLMAFLIHSEEEKRQLHGEIQDLHATIVGRDQLVVEKEKVVADMKSKLHSSFKEFLSMNKTMAVLRVEAAKGSEMTQGRNEILQRNLDKLARDYEATTKQLTTTQDHIRDLEFELEELVIQFNLTGEGKRASEEHAKKLAAELDRTAGELASAQDVLGRTEVKRGQLEVELQDMHRLHTDTKYELNLKISHTTSELETVTEQRKELEASLRMMKAENEKLSFSLKGVTRAKDQLESAFRVSTQKYEKEIQTRDSKIHDLGSLREEDAKGLKRVLEQKEQLMFQVTDLQNALNRETASLNMANFEMAQLKRQSEEKGSLLEDQVEKLNAARLGLAADKRQVTERYKQTRLELQEKEVELEHIKTEFARWKDRSTKAEADMRTELAEVKDAHSVLKGSFASFEDNLAKALSAQETAESRAVKMEALYEELVVREADALRSLAHYTTDNARLAADLTVAETERLDVKTHLESVVTKVDELSRTMTNMEAEYSTTVKEKDKQITRLSKEAYDSREDALRLDKLSKKLRKLVDKLDGELHVTKSTLTTETSQREFLEGTLYDIRQSLHSERQIRLEFERMHARLDRRESERESERLASLRMRDRLLSEVAVGLNSEHARLKDISKMLPKDSDQGLQDTPEIKDFKPVGAAPFGAAGRVNTPIAPGPGFKLVIRKPAKEDHGDK